MSENKPEKLVIVVTHGTDNPKKATIPFVVGNARIAMEAKVVMVLEENGVQVATKGSYERIRAPGFDPLKKLVDSLLELGGTILVCIPCLESRKITPDQLISGVQRV